MKKILVLLALLMAVSAASARAQGLGGFLKKAASAAATAATAVQSASTPAPEIELRTEPLSTLHEQYDRTWNNTHYTTAEVRLAGSKQVAAKLEAWALCKGKGCRMPKDGTFGIYLTYVYDPDHTSDPLDDRFARVTLAGAGESIEWTSLDQHVRPSGAPGITVRVDLPLEGDELIRLAGAKGPLTLMLGSQRFVLDVAGAEVFRTLARTVQ